MQFPFLEDPLDIALAAGARDDEHSLLRLTEHHFVWSHGLRSARHERDVDPHADPAFCRDFADGARQSGGAEVLHRLDRVGVDQFERGLEEQLFKERITHLDRRTLGIRPGAELERREQRRASDPVAAGVATDQVHRAARSRAARLAEIFGACETDTHRVDQRVIGVARLERDVPGDVGDADAVSVKGDAAGHARDRAADGGIGRIAEEERVQHRGRARAHREDVAQDPADTGGSSLERFDGGRMVVALDFEDTEKTAAEIDGSGVLAGTDGN